MIIDRKIYEVICDGCHELLRDKDGRIRHFDLNIQAISAARDAGWAVNLTGNRDLCPRCAAKQDKQTLF